MKILLTGGSGFVGKNVIEYFGENYPGMYEITAPSSSELDCVDEEAVDAYLSEHDFDVVLHFANYSGVRHPDRDHSKMLENNLRSYLNFAKNAHRYGRMFYAGSGAEYDKRNDLVSVTEEEIGKSIPVSPYGIMKYTVGKLIESSENIYNIRLFGIFGKYEYYPTKFISGLCAKAVKGLPFTMRQNVYFDYLYIDDFCRMLHLMLQKEKLNHHTYNLVSGQRISLMELVDLVNEASGKETPVYVCREGLAREYTASNARFIQEFGNFDYTDPGTSVKALYRWFADHEDEIDLSALIYG